MFIRQNDGDFSEDLTNCDGSDVDIIASTNCLVPIMILRDSTYQLPWGSSITAKVVAYNLYGYSAESLEGNGAVILTYPDAPINVAETVEARTASTITFTWSEGAANGGAPVEDYRVTYDQSTGTYVVLASAVNALTFTATELTAGYTYKFKIEARNSYGYSVYSEVVSILCATSPSRPDVPTTTVDGNEVIVEWEAPADNGTPITAYQIFFRKSDDTYQTELTSCDGTNADVVAFTQCIVPLSVLTAAPYDLSVLGSSINVKITAINDYGES